MGILEYVHIMPMIIGNSEEDGNQTSADYHVIHGVIA